MIENQANDPSRTSWIPVPQNSDFPIQNLPFGVFIPEDDIITTGTRIGDTAIDLSALQQLGYFKGIDLPDDVFLQDTLNDFIALGRPHMAPHQKQIGGAFRRKQHHAQSECRAPKSGAFSCRSCTNVDAGIRSRLYRFL